MHTIASIVVPGARIVRGYAERLLKGIDSSNFARMPTVGGKKIEMNHPAFIIGHLSLYPGRFAEFLEIDIPGSSVPASYPDLFKDGVQCIDDADGTKYPPMNEIVANYLQGTDAMIAKLPEVPDSAFSREMPDPKRRERFPTVGAFAIYIAATHSNGHLGQLSAWRRCMGMGPA